jgi:tRNA(Arg) A34 adenosine deaminase TadA
MTHLDQDQHYMRLALDAAKQAAALGEVPVGAVLVKDGQVVGVGHNHPVALHDPTAHAEVNAMRAAAHKLGNYRLEDCTLYVTLEPCTMCSGAALHARLKRVVFGAAEPKTGAAGSVLNVFASRQINHQTQVQGGVLADECAAVLQDFFAQRREAQQRDKVPLREDALRTPESALLGLDWPAEWSHYANDWPVLNGLRLHWLDNRSSFEPAADIYLHGPEGWSAQYVEALRAGRSAVALDLPGFGLSDKPKKATTHRLDWHAQVIRAFVAHVAPQGRVHAPRVLAPMLQGLEGAWIDEPAIPAALRDAPYPDAGHKAGPRALQTLLGQG